MEVLSIFLLNFVVRATIRYNKTLLSCNIIFKKFQLNVKVISLHLISNV